MNNINIKDMVIDNNTYCLVDIDNKMDDNNKINDNKMDDGDKLNDNKMDDNNKLNDNKINDNKMGDNNKDIFVDQKQLIRCILKLYKNIFNHKYFLYLSECGFIDKLIEKKIQDIFNMVPAYLDFCYIYFIRYYDNTAPVFELPKILDKFNMMYKVIKINNNKAKQAFCNIINNKIIKDIISQPPYYIRNTIDINKFLDIIKNIEPVCKNVLSELVILPT